MVSLRAALLFLLTSEPMTGYETTKRFASSVGNVWHAPDSQIYPELRRMEESGLISGREVPWGSKGAVKREYAVTDAGLAALHTWQRETPKYLRERDPARLRAAYLEWADVEAARTHYLAHIEHFEAERSAALEQQRSIQSGANATIEHRLAHYAPADRERVRSFKVHAYAGMIARARTEIAWARKGLADLDGYAGPLDYAMRADASMRAVQE